jgi:hypothetical protein
VAGFALKNIIEGSEQDFSRGVYIILFEATKIPPHLLLSVDGKIYSITDSGKQTGSPLEKLLNFIKRKNIATLFIEIVTAGIRNDVSPEENAKKHFLNYDRVIEGKVSCLFPIRDVMAEIFGDEMLQAEFIFELLPLLEKENALGKVYSLNMEIADGEFELLTYTRDQLAASLQANQF